MLVRTTGVLDATVRCWPPWRWNSDGGEGGSGSLVTFVTRDLIHRDSIAEFQDVVTKSCVTRVINRRAVL